MESCEQKEKTREAKHPSENWEKCHLWVSVFVSVVKFTSAHQEKPVPIFSLQSSKWGFFRYKRHHSREANLTANRVHHSFSLTGTIDKHFLVQKNHRSPILKKFRSVSHLPQSHSIMNSPWKVCAVHETIGSWVHSLIGLIVNLSSNTSTEWISHATQYNSNTFLIVKSTNH